MDRSAREIAAEAVPVEQAPQGARRRPTHRDMPDRRGGDFFDRLDHAPGGSLGATEEGRPVRQDRPHLPHSARNRLKRLQASPPEGRGLPTSPIPPTPQETGSRTLAAPAAGAWRSLMPDFTAHRHPVMTVPCPACRAAPGTWCRRPSGHRAAELHMFRTGARSAPSARLWPLGRDPAGSRYWPLGDRGGEYSDRGAAVILEEWRETAWAIERRRFDAPGPAGADRHLR